jgi:hypothetical protein
MVLVREFRISVRHETMIDKLKQRYVICGLDVRLRRSSIVRVLVCLSLALLVGVSFSKKTV